MSTLRYPTGLFCFLSLLFLIPRLSFAAYSIQNDSIIAIEQVKIGAKRELEQIPPLELKEIEIRHSTAQNVADALRYLAGVQVKDYGGIGGLKTVNVRSLGSQHVAVSYDGVLVGNAQNGTVDLGRFSLDNVERISLYHGQRASLLQPARDYLSGALVAIQTRAPQFDTTYNIRLQATLRGGSFGLLNPQFLYEQRLGTRFALSVNGEVIEAHGRYPFRYVGYNRAGKKVYDTTAIRHDGDVHTQRLEAALYGKIVEGDWRLRVYGYHSERGLPGPIVNNVWQRGERLADNTLFVQANLRKDFSSFHRTQLLAKYAYDDTHYRQLDPRFYAANLFYQQQEAYLSSIHAFRFTSWLEGSLAYDLLWNTLASFDRLRHLVTLGAVRPQRISHYIATTLAFQHQGLHLCATCVATGAYRGKETGTPLAMWQYLPALYAFYSPRAMPRLSFHAFGKQTLRLPTFNELYYVDWGNPALRPEFATQMGTGLQWHYTATQSFFRKFDVLADLYYNRISDKIIAYPARGQFRWTTINIGKVAMRGAEVSFLLQSRELGWHQFSLRLQYAYTEATDRTDPRSVYYQHQIPYIPWHSGSVVFNYTWRNCSLYYSFLYTGERYHQQENNPYNYEPAWYTNDLAVALKFNIFAHPFLLRLELNNLLDQQYAVVLNYPMPGRNFRITLQTTFLR